MRKVRGSFLFLGSNQGVENEIRKNSVEGGKEKKRKEKRKKKGKEKKKRKEKKEKKRKKGKKMRKKKIGGRSMRGGERKKKKKKKGSNSRCYDGWKSLVRELNLVYLTRATSRFQKQKR